MAVTRTAKTSGTSTSNVQNYDPASITPGANKLITALVLSSRGSSTDPSVPTMSGNGMTWVEVGNVLVRSTGTIRGRLTLFRAMHACPSAGQPQIQHAAAGTGCAWIIEEWDGVDTSGTNGSGAVVQFNSNGPVTATTCTVTLSALTSGNVGYAGYGSVNSALTFSPEGGGTPWTEQPAAEVTYSTPSCWLGAMYRLASDDNTPTGTSSASDTWGGLAIEIKAGTTAHSLASVIAGTGTVAPALRAGMTPEVLISASAALAPSLKVLHPVAVLIDGSATVSPALKANRGLATAIGGVGTLAAAVKVNRGLSTTIGAVGTVTPALTHIPGAGGTAHSLAAVLDGIATVSPALRARMSVATTIAGSGAVAPALKANRGLSVGVSGTGALSPALRLRAGLATTIGAELTVVPQLTETNGEPEETTSLYGWVNQYRKATKRGR